MPPPPDGSSPGRQEGMTLNVVMSVHSLVCGSHGRPLSSSDCRSLQTIVPALRTLKTRNLEDDIIHCYLEQIERAILTHGAVRGDSHSPAAMKEVRKNWTQRRNKSDVRQKEQEKNLANSNKILSSSSIIIKENSTVNSNGLESDSDDCEDEAAACQSNNKSINSIIDSIALNEKYLDENNATLVDDQISVTVKEVDASLFNTDEDEGTPDEGGGRSAFYTALDDLCSPELPDRGHALITLTKLMDASDPTLLSNKNKVRKLIELNIKDEDTYIYLSASECYAALCTLLPKEVSICYFPIYYLVKSQLNKT